MASEKDNYGGFEGISLFMPVSQTVTRSGIAKRYQNLSRHIFTSDEKKFVARELLGHTNFLNLGPPAHASKIFAGRHNLEVRTLRRWRVITKKGRECGPTQGGKPFLLDAEAKKEVFSKIDGNNLTEKEANRVILNGARQTKIRRSVSSVFSITKCLRL